MNKYVAACPTYTVASNSVLTTSFMRLASVAKCKKTKCKKATVNAVRKPTDDANDDQEL